MLIFNPAAIGDTILTTPLISALKKSFPEDEITYITTKTSRIIINNNPEISDIKEVESQWEILKIIKNIKKEEKLLILRKHPLFYLEPLLLGKNTYGFDKNGVFSSLKIKSKKLRLLNFPTRFFPKYEAYYYLDIIKLLGVHEEFDNRTNFFFPKSFIGNEPSPKQKYVVLCPFAGNKMDKQSHYRNWPSDNYLALAEELSKKYKVLIVGKTEDTKAISKFENAPVDMLVNKTNLEQSAQILKNAELVVTNDCGLLHLSAAVDSKRMIALFGPTSPIRVMPPWKGDYVYLTPKDRDPHIDYYTSGTIKDYFKKFNWPSVRDVLEKVTELGL